MAGSYGDGAVDFAALNRKLLAAVRRIATGKSSTRNERLPLRQAILKAGYRFTYPETEGDAAEDMEELINDLLSTARIDFSLNFNVARIQGRRNWISELDSVTLMVNPGRQFVVVGGTTPETAANWVLRWNIERGKLGSATRATVARQNGLSNISNAFAIVSDPIWSALSRFDVPYPPYGFDLNLMVTDISYEESVSHGIMLATDDVRRPALLPSEPILFGLDLDLSPFEEELKALFG